jgi:hypothetical protein
LDALERLDPELRPGAPLAQAYLSFANSHCCSDPSLGGSSPALPRRKRSV